MQIFQKDKTHLSATAHDRLQKLLGGRNEFSETSEPAQVIVAPPPQAVRPILKIVITAIVATGFLVWLNRPAPLAMPETAIAGIPIAAISTAPASGQGIDQIVVDVKGDVENPGLVTLSAGARVADAIFAAGGVVPSANVSTLNLAERLTDGQMIFVGNAESMQSSSDPRINLNIATEADLDSLPGVGPVMAGRIIAWRDTNQRFRSIEELQEVPGIGPKVFANLKPLVRI
jgi:competence protein ComEA